MRKYSYSCEINALQHFVYNPAQNPQLREFFAPPHRVSVSPAFINTTLVLTLEVSVIGNQVGHHILASQPGELDI
jgi:hypothetical protein